MSKETKTVLEKSLGPLMLWGLGTGYVISGNYFGWNLGLKEGGTYGLAIALAFVIVMYIFFTFCYTEMACAIPKAGGAFDYAQVALGSNWAFVGGLAQIIEFLFAPPAIALGLGAYLGEFLPGVHPLLSATVAYLLFTGLNISGIKTAASFELFVTFVAVAGLLVFAGAALPSFQFENLKSNAFPNGWLGIPAAVPFAIWFFLAIEGVANVAEETINPQKNILRGFGSALVTLIVLCFLTFLSSVGAAGANSVLYPPGSETASDSPLPLALSTIHAPSALITIIAIFGLFGVVASFNGILLAAGRASYEFARAGNAPKWISIIHPRFKTPVNALIINMLIGLAALFSGKTGEIIIMACFGALTLYIISMISFIKLRKAKHELPRPFKAPLASIAPVIVIIIAAACMVSMIYFYQIIALVYFGIVFSAFLFFKLFIKSPKG